MAFLIGDAENHLSFARGVLALRGNAVDRAGSAGVQSVPQAWQQRRRERDGDDFHVTLLGKADLQSVADRLRQGAAWPGGSAAAPSADDPAAVAGAAARLLPGGPGALVWADVGEGRAGDGDAEAAFRVVTWPAGAVLRASLELPPLDFHVTLGFNGRDVHGRSKGPASLLSGAPRADAAPRLVAAAKALLASANASGALVEGAEQLANASLQTAEAHGDAHGEVAALEALCLARGRLQRPRQVLEAADRLVAADARSAVGHKSRAAALVALRRHADAQPTLLSLRALLRDLPPGGDKASLQTWCDQADRKCRMALGLPEKLFPGPEDCASEADDEEFEGAFLTSGSRLKFPSTAHLKNLGAATRDDKVCDELRKREFCGGRRMVSVEEKIDGANLGISLDSVYRPRMQARSKMVNWKTDMQFAGLEAWLEQHSASLCEVLERNNDILFGEWCAYLHTVKYSRLPGYFLAFDIYDRRRGCFLSREAFHTRLARVAGPKIPVVPMVCPPRVFSRVEEVEELLERQAAFGEGLLEGVYLRIDETSPVPGESESCLVDRCKLVRAEFQQAIEDEGTWRGRGKNELDIALASTYVEQCYPCAHAEQGST